MTTSFLVMKPLRNVLEVGEAAGGAHARVAARGGVLVFLLCRVDRGALLARPGGAGGRLELRLIYVFMISNVLYNTIAQWFFPHGIYCITTVFEPLVIHLYSLLFILVVLRPSIELSMGRPCALACATASGLRQDESASSLSSGS